MPYLYQNKNGFFVINIPKDKPHPLLIMKHLFDLNANKIDIDILTTKEGEMLYEFCREIKEKVGI